MAMAAHQKRLKWTPRQRRFVEEYLATFNGAEAARRAGYSSHRADIQAARLMGRAEIRERIAARIAEVAMSADEVLLRLAEQARGDIGQLMNAEGTLDLAAARRAGLTRLVESISDTDRGLRVEMYDAQRALELLGKHLGLFTDSVQAGIAGGEIVLRVVYGGDDGARGAPA